MSNEYRNDDPLWLPKGIAPSGMVYAWASECTNLAKGFYNIVPRDRHPYVYSDDSIPGTISRKGSFLVESKEIVQEARDIIRQAEYERDVGNIIRTNSIECVTPDSELYKKHSVEFNSQNEGILYPLWFAWFHSLNEEVQKKDDNWDKFINDIKRINLWLNKD